MLSATGTRFNKGTRLAGGPAAPNDASAVSIGVSSASSAFLAALETVVEIGLEADAGPLFGQATTLQSSTHGLDRAGEDELGPVCARHPRRLAERCDRRGIHPGHALQVDHQEPRWRCLKTGPCADTCPLQAPVSRRRSADPTRIDHRPLVGGGGYRRAMAATLDDVARIALGLPDVTEDDRRGQRAWAVAGKTFAWERAYSKADLKRFGDEEPPREPIVAIRVDDSVEKEAVLAAGTKGIFTISHFDGYAAVLVELRNVGKRALKEALIDGWLACAPPRLAKEHANRL